VPTEYDLLPLRSSRSVSIHIKIGWVIHVARVLHVIAETDFDLLKTHRNICNTRDTKALLSQQPRSFANSLILFMVRAEGLEPPRFSSREPKDLPKATLPSRIQRVFFEH
jgi:hypothetical protein